MGNYSTIALSHRPRFIYLFSEEWLERRTNFTRSLAVMSMVGYILGLGDRHPSNLMLDQISGRILHIDFGDCFEGKASIYFHRQLP